MKSSVSLLVVGVLACFDAGHAAAPEATSHQGRLEPVSSVSAPPADATTPAAVCENGEARDDSGACPVVDDSASTRGFTLFSGAAVRSQASMAAKAAPTSASDARQPAQRAFACGSVCDLKLEFAVGSTQLTAESQARLEQFADALRGPSARGARYEIGGHTDALGTPHKNVALSQARAEAVTSFLIAHGVAAARLVAHGYGAEGLAIPDAPNDPRNRRVEARLLN